mgnify:CR=1 FL=1
MVGFRDADVALLVGAHPRGSGMKKSDLLQANASISQTQGKALNEVASCDVKVLVVGKPCNTNAWIAMKNAPDLKLENFSALMRWDQNRAEAQLVKHLQVRTTDLAHMTVCGNHFPSMVADVTFTTVCGESAFSKLDSAWLEKEFAPTVAKRGGAILAARGASSAACAVSASVDYIHDWVLRRRNVG